MTSGIATKDSIMMKCPVTVLAVKITFPKRPFTLNAMHAEKLYAKTMNHYFSLARQPV